MTHGVIISNAPRLPPDERRVGAVPKVRLYVEQRKEENWFVHVGHVTERGRWRTEPHAHPGYGQLIFVRNGCGVMNLEGRSVAFEGPCALIVPTDCIHGLDYKVDVDRWVVTIEVSWLTQVNAKLREFIALWSAPRMIPFVHCGDAANEIYAIVQRLKHEIETNAVGQIAGTEALLTMLLLTLIRTARLEPATHDSMPRHDVRLVERFRKLIDEHYRSNLPLQDYASMLAVSLVQLRAACASAKEKSPTKMIHARIITEAKRELIFGDMSVEQIAFWLGFADAAYFTRFFRREVGQTPSQFRTEARR
ncbi:MULTISPECIES: helix-turn-helix domain-containing protein [Paraburkholderia]|uniref:AraC family transcriptional activator of pobA n=1 Tax=Paraburkholderia tropica TaxID=92647 RepID=A0ABX5MC00_9BURK|nr:MULTISPECIES: helix-turn-helix domain-containing protein [Paraburkholderia]MBB2984597.1 AraC family transcriptional activator of pobA [Paraburkholderia tropica]MBB3005247.1 AraC family transcriptional activator of pobA [Paraburkholderia tropica]MBB6324198.1 AraC family transcriptional activator of pobA [Paraburkholderia tropica]MDE1140409.1 helix-turn-helix domain-containing protein [Paraburkholderia tropica]PXX03314.1 AraC family transcriptional activator of pobA [Paraburkholderia tropica]